MEHRDDAPLADESQPGAIPNDQPAGGAGPGEAREPDSDGDDDDDDGQAEPSRRA